MINPRQDVSLRNYSTMRLGGKAAYLVDIESSEQIPESIEWAEARSLPVKMIGGGSNIIWSDEGFKGLVLVNKIMGFELDGSGVLVVGAGEDWDSVVARSVEAGWSGIEQLSLIPGSTGATPVQNVGAYGREIADVLLDVSAYDRASKQMVTIPVADCAFAYRTSRFKTTDKDRFFITGVRLQLNKTNPAPPFYEVLQDYFVKHPVAEYTPAVVREAVIAIRSAKLPDPAKVANCGSFFHNPIIGATEFAQLKLKQPKIPNWPQTDGRFKISAAWLIEQAGLKDYHDEETGMATWPTQALTFVNEHADSTADLLAFKQKVAGKVKDLFDIELQQEPELVTVPK